MAAVGRCRTPRKLERQNGQQKEKDVAAHGRSLADSYEALHAEPHGGHSGGSHSRSRPQPSTPARSGDRQSGRCATVSRDAEGAMPGLEGAPLAFPVDQRAERFVRFQPRVELHAQFAGSATGPDAGRWRR